MSVTTAGITHNRLTSSQAVCSRWRRWTRWSCGCSSTAACNPSPRGSPTELIGLDPRVPPRVGRRVLRLRIAEGADAPRARRVRGGHRAVVLHAGAHAHASWPANVNRSGNVLAALLGIVTPFCSCSAVPLFIGFVTAGVPLGVTFSFLISAPMVNEVAVVLLFGLFGWKVAAILHCPRAWSSPSSRAGSSADCASSATSKSGSSRPRPEARACPTSNSTGPTASRPAWQAMRDIVGKVWPYVLAGHRRWRRHPRLRARELHGVHHGQGRVVERPGGGAHRHPDVLERRRHHPGRAGPARQGRRSRHRARIHDGRHRTVAAGGRSSCAAFSNPRSSPCSSAWSARAS